MTLEIISYIVLALALSTTAFSIALYSSIHRCVEMDEALLMGVIFSAFSGVLMLLGWLIGLALVSSLTQLAFPIATLILFFIGIRKLADARRVSPEQRAYPGKNIRMLAGFALAQGINSFLAGVGLGLIQLNIWIQTTILIFAIFIMIQIGVRLGKYGRYRFGMQSEAAGGLLIIIMAAFMVVNLVVN